MSLLDNPFTPAKQIMVRVVIAALLAAAVALVLFGGTAKAGEPCRKPRKTIIVTDNIPPELLPAVVAKMTPKQFEAYAKQRNAEAYAQAKTNHENYLALRGPLRSVTMIETGGTQTTRYGGGSGYNGVAGPGGYLGYNGFASGYSNPPAGYPACGVPNFGNGNGNTVRVSETSYDRSYKQEFPDLNDAGGGGVFLINPFCFDYWVKHTEPEDTE